MTGLVTAKSKNRWPISAMEKAPFTSLMVAAAIMAYGAVQGPPAEPQTPFEFIANLFRHRDILHLSLNLFVIAYAGSYCESVKGGRFMLGIGIGSLLVGSIMEYLLIDGRFIGLSAGAFGLAAWSATYGYATTPSRSLRVAVFFLIIIAAGFSDTAIVAHAAGALTGGLIAMLGYFFKKKSPTPATAQTNAEQTRYTFRPMTLIDLSDVVEIIAMTDEDDAEEAKQSLTDRGCPGMYVLEEAGHIVGVTGYYRADDADDVAWLSWTYLHPAAQREGGGKYMINELLLVLNGENIRKLFIATSDYCEDGEAIYASAHAFYESLGATREVRVDDYHDDGEAMIIYGLGNRRYDSQKPQTQEWTAGVSFLGIHAAAESANGQEIRWQASSETRDVSGLEACVSQARQQKARILLLALPEDIANAVSTSLADAGFVKCGVLQDYYEKGLGQAYWTMKAQ